MALQEPPATCAPSVNFCPAQSSIKLFCEVREALCPADAPVWPSPLAAEALSINTQIMGHYL